MKKIIYIAFAAVLAGFAISCQKEAPLSENTTDVQYTFNITVNDQVGFDSDASTKGGSSEKYKSGWENKDKIFLFFKPTEGSLLADTYATLTYDGSSWDGAVTGTTSLGEEGTLSAVYVYNLGDETPEFSTDKWTIATGNTFYNCQTVSYTVSGNEISAALSLAAPADFVRFYVTNATGALTCDKVKGWKDIAIGGNLAVSNVTCTGYMDGVANTGDNNVMEYYGRIINAGTSLENVDCEFSVVKDGKVYERNAKPSTAARSFKMTVATDKWTEAKGKLPGLFKISKGVDDTDGTEDDVLVRFSQGNLTCDISGATPDWKFYEHQYDCATGYDANLISLFTWGYDATKSIDPDGTEYVTSHTTDGGSFTPTEDWGTQIGDGNTWRTLTHEEWCILFAYDPGNYDFIEGHPRKQLFKYGVTVCDKANCVVLLPDNWNETIISLTNFATTTEYSSTTTPTWSAMEAAGAVCLPAAGLRDGSNVCSIGDNGYYWSSTAPKSDLEYNYDFAYIVIFSSLDVSPGNQDFRSPGYSVRLITDVK